MTTKERMDSLYQENDVKFFNEIRGRVAGITFCSNKELLTIYNLKIGQNVLLTKKTIQPNKWEYYMTNAILVSAPHLQYEGCNGNLWLELWYFPKDNGYLSSDLMTEYGLTKSDINYKDENLLRKVNTSMETRNINEVSGIITNIWKMDKRVTGIEFKVLFQ